MSYDPYSKTPDSAPATPRADTAKRARDQQAQAAWQQSRFRKREPHETKGGGYSSDPQGLERGGERGERGGPSPHKA